MGGYLAAAKPSPKNPRIKTDKKLIKQTYSVLTGLGVREFQKAEFASIVTHPGIAYSAEWKRVNA